MHWLLGVFCCLFLILPLKQWALATASGAEWIGMYCALAGTLKPKFRLAGTCHAPKTDSCPRMMFSYDLGALTSSEPLGPPISHTSISLIAAHAPLPHVQGMEKAGLDDSWVPGLESCTFTVTHCSRASKICWG